MQDAYQQRRQGILEGLEANEGDKSRKGSVDVRALGVINAVNASHDMYTTSSCSGRTSIFAEPTAETRLAGKKGGEWVYTSHDPPVEEEVLQRLHDRYSSGAMLVFRFEPFLLHAEVSNMEAASRLLAAARISGFRESGATQGNKRIMVGIRSSLRLEVPVADGGQLLVNDDYIRFLVRLANQKFEANTERMKKLEEAILKLNSEAVTAAATTSVNESTSQQGVEKQRQGKGKGRSEAGLQRHNDRAATTTTQHQTTEENSSPLNAVSMLPNNTDAQHVIVARNRNAVASAQTNVAKRTARKLKGVTPELVTPLQDLRARQVALLKRLSDLQQRIQGSQGCSQAKVPKPVIQAEQLQKKSASSSKQKRHSDTSKSATHNANKKHKSDVTFNHLQHSGKPVVNLVKPSARVNLAALPAAMPTEGADQQTRPTHSTAEAHVPPEDGLAWSPMRLHSNNQAFDPESLLRWGSASVTWRNQIVLVGGYGGAGTHARRADVLIGSLDSSPSNKERFIWKVLECQGPGPSPRMGHTASLIGDFLVVVGGRASPAQPLDDAWLLHLPTATWLPIKTTTTPCNASSHSSHETTQHKPAANQQMMSDHGTHKVSWGSSHPVDFGDSTEPAAENGDASKPSQQACSWPGRYRHATVVVGGSDGGAGSASGSGLSKLPSRLLIFGGAGLQGVRRDLWALIPPTELCGLNADSAVSLNALANGWQWIEIAGPETQLQGEASNSIVSEANAASDSSNPDSFNRNECWPPALKSHAAVVLNGYMYLHGGTASYGGHQHVMYRLCLDSVGSYLAAQRQGIQNKRVVWDIVEPSRGQTDNAVTQGASPAAGGGSCSYSTEHQVASISHHLTPFNNRYLLMTGGHPTVNHKWLYVYDTVLAVWMKFPIFEPNLRHPDLIQNSSWMPIRHCVALLTTNSQTQSVEILVNISQPKKLTSAASKQISDEHTQQKQVLVVIGGGAFCFSFGSVFSGAFTCDLQHLMCHTLSDPNSNSNKPSTVTLQSAANSTVLEPSSSTTVALNATSAPDLNQCSTSYTSINGNNNYDNSKSEQGYSNWVLQLPARSAKPVKDALKQAGWLDTRRKGGELSKFIPTPSQQTGDALSQQQAAACHEGVTSGVPMVVLPLTASAVKVLLPAMGNTLSENGYMDAAPNMPKEINAALLAGAQLLQLTTGINNKYVTGPHERMRHAVAGLLPAGLPAKTVTELLEDLPTKWETLGDLSLIPEECLTHPAWQQCFNANAKLQQAIYSAIAQAIGVPRLARQARIANTGTRDSQAVLLLGDNGWVTHQEHGVTFVLDVQRCMFSSGNITERGRMGRLQAEGETVVDMFTGIGYYTLPLLVKAKVAKVYACEWNPAALECLAKGLEANKVSHKCEVRAGDCRLTAPQAVADRVLLGLLPHSNIAWPAAVAALKPTGGWLHVHNNVLDSDEDKWIKNMVSELQRLCQATPGKQGWDVMVHHLEHVKWYAPRIRHIVVDVQLRPPTAHGHQPPPAEARQAAVAVNGSLSSSGTDATVGQTQPLAVDGSTASSTATKSTSQCPWFKRSFIELRHVDVLDSPTREQFEAKLQACPAPLLLSGLPLGDAMSKWSPGYLQQISSGRDNQVSVHVTREPSGAMDFVNKNFVYRTMPWPELVARVTGDNDSSHTPILQGQDGEERYYLRSLGTDPRKDISDLATTFPELWADLTIPDLFPQGSLFSSILRLSSPGLQLWTHFDVMDNLLIQIKEQTTHRSGVNGSRRTAQHWSSVMHKGVKRVLLWPPLAAPDLYTQGSSSPITNITNPDMDKYPRFANAVPIVAELHPGQVLYIPALWHHHVTTLTPTDNAVHGSNTAQAQPGPTASGSPTSNVDDQENGWSLSVNVFWRHLDAAMYDKKDVYGNKDLVPAASADAKVQDAAKHLAQLPEPYKSFYTQRCIYSLAEGAGLAEDLEKLVCD